MTCLEAQQILDTLSFNYYEDQETLPVKVLRQKIIDEINLPEFYTFRKEEKPIYTIHVDASKGFPLITISDAETGEPVGGTFGDIEKAYNYVKNTLEGDVQFSGDVKSVANTRTFSEDDDDEDFRSVSVEHIAPNGYKTYTMLLSTTKHDEQFLAKHDYLNFLLNTVEYEKKPNDFFEAFYWLDKHPAFWSRYDDKSNDWNTNNNGRIWVGITKDDEGNVVVMLEHGAAVPPARTQHYHDLKLDVYSSTYEEGIIELAALVHKFFHVDGSKRENVDYEKSELELILSERIAEFEEAYPSSQNDDTDEED